MSDDIRRLSDELARDPASLVFLRLGEALRRGGQLDLALRVAMRGLERHAHNADAHDLLARIAVDRGELERAFDEWDMVLRLSPRHLGASKGMGYVLFKQRRFEEAERYLSAAAENDGEDETIATALAMVRRQLDDRASGQDTPVTRTPATLRDARALFDDILGDGEYASLLLDASGLVMAGSYLTHDGRDVAQDVGAGLSGVSDEARRAMRHLQLGEWSSLVFETDAAIVAMSPMSEDRLVVVASGKSSPLGLVQRVLERCDARGRAWLEAES